MPSPAAPAKAPVSLYGCLLQRKGLNSVSKVLLVEDEPMVRSVAERALTRHGYTVITADNGEDALECCRNGGADVLITDIRLPGPVDGWDIAECCRADHPTLHVSTRPAFRRRRTGRCRAALPFRSLSTQARSCRPSRGRSRRARIGNRDGVPSDGPEGIWSANC